MLLVDLILSLGGVEFHEQIPFLHIGAFRDNVNDARGSLDVAPNADFTHGCERSAVEHGDREITAFDFVERGAGLFGLRPGDEAVDDGGDEAEGDEEDRLLAQRRWNSVG